MTLKLFSLVIVEGRMFSVLGDWIHRDTATAMTRMMTAAMMMIYRSF